MLRILALTCLLAAAAAQTIFYCGSGVPIQIKNMDFYLVTRARASDSSYPQGLSCDFQAQLDYPYKGYLVEIESFHVSTALLIIESRSTLFAGSRLASYQSTIVTSSASLRVRFTSLGDFSRSGGVRIRVRAFELNGCPPGWTFLLGNCYGTSSTAGRLNFTDAQKACNSMRSNLLQVPITYLYNLQAFLRLLPTRLKSYYTWIGMTDKTSAGRYKHYWLSGERQFSTSEISCVSGGSYSTCYSNERCAAIYDKSSSSYTVFMDQCSDLNNFACSMPPDGTSYFYRIPDVGSPDEGSIIVRPSSYGTASWIWGVFAAGLFVVGLIVVGVYTGIRSRNTRRNIGAASVVVSTGRVTIQPPSTAYPVQRPPYPQQYPQQNPPLYPTDKVLNAPPPYHTVAGAGAGYGNSGYHSNP